MIREAVLRINIPDNWVGEISRKYAPDIKFIECMPHGETGGRSLIEIRGDESEINEILHDIETHPDVKSIENSFYTDGKVLASIITRKCSACRALAKSDCFLICAVCLGDGRVEWRLITSGEGSLSNLIRYLEDYNCTVELMNSCKLTKKKLLTQRQEEIVRIALEKGYYDYPKRVTVKELAKIFNVSPSTIGRSFRGVRKKL